MKLQEKAAQFFFAPIIFLSVYLFVSPLFAQDTKPVDSGKVPTLEFNGATVEQVIQMYSDLTGRTAIRSAAIAPMMQIKIILKSNGPLTKEETLTALENVLAANGISIVPQGEKFFKVVNSATAKMEAVPVVTQEIKRSPTDQVTSQVFVLNYALASEVDPIIRTMATQGTSIVQFPRTNSIMVTDRASNILEMEKVIKLLDVKMEGKVQTKFYALVNAKAKDVLARIDELLKSSTPNAATNPNQFGRFGNNAALNAAMSNIQYPAGTTRPGQPGAPLTLNEEAIVSGTPRMSADERTNQLIVITRPSNFEFFDELIKALDSNTADPLVLEKIPLKYASAKDLAALVGDVLNIDSTSSQSTQRSNAGASGGTSGSSPSSNSRNRSNTQQQPQQNTQQTQNQNRRNPNQQNANQSGTATQEELRVRGDERTNSLIVWGTEAKIKWLKGFVEDVDVPLQQVILDALVVEVTLDRTDTLGVEVLNRSIGPDSAHALLSHSLSITPLSAAAIAPGAIPAGIGTGLNYFATLQNPKIDLIVQALSKNTNAKVLSRPVIQTSHNQPAQVSVGQRVPYAGQTQNSIDSTTSTTTTQNATTEFADVLIKLDVTPLINPGGLVTLDVKQDVNTIASFTKIGSNDVPVISTKHAESLVSVQDRDTIILGGLIGDTESVTRSGIPLLSEIPFLGALFGSTKKDKLRTELMVFITPTVLPTPKAASEEALWRRQQLELYNKKKSLIDKKTVNDKIDEITTPRTVPADPLDENTVTPYVHSNVTKFQIHEPAPTPETTPKAK